VLQEKDAKMKRAFSLLVIVACLLVGNLLADDTFKDGETVCFVGDSITHGHIYDSMICNYYLTRFPDRTIHFVNAGVGGDTAGGVMGRLKEDVTSKSPTVIAIMFGMNDVNRGVYVANPTAQQLEQQAAALKWYRTNMEKLLERLSKETSARFVLLTPSPFDQTCLNDHNNNWPGCNDGLGKCADIVRETASKFKAKVADLHSPMTSLNLKLQQSDPKYTLIGPDRVHPGMPGHFVMAWLFLKAQGAPALVSSVTIDAATAIAAESENAAATNIKQKDGGLTFTVLAKALPCPVDPSARSILGHISFEKDLNQEILRIKGLAAGDYELLIDGVAVCKHSAADWAAGVNLALNDKTPQAKQAAYVAQINDQRRGVECQLRNYAAVRWFLRNQGVSPDDPAAIKTFAETKMNKTGYFEQQVPTYLKEWSNRGQLQAQANDLEKKALASRTPASHSYEIRPMR